MRTNLKRVLCVFLLSCMAFCLFACGDGNNDGTSSASSDGTSATSSGDTVSVDPDAGYLNDEGKYQTKLGVLDAYRGREFTILVEGEDFATYQSDDFTTAPGSGGIDYGEAFYTQVGARNDKIEEDYDVQLVVVKSNDPLGDARQDAQAGNQQFDAMVIHVDRATALAQEDLLCNLYTLEKFDASAPWWDANANMAYSVGNKLYFTTGDITIMNKANTWCILFNKDMITDYGLDDPYQLVENGTWTYDKMCEMARTVNNSTASSDYNDTSVVYGMVAWYNDAFEFYGGSGLTLCEKDATDNPTLSFGENEVSLTLAEEILTSFRDSDYTLWAQTAGMQNAFKVFYTGRALFRPSGFTAVTKCRTLAEMLFGILPMPKMLENQDEYYTNGTGTFVACILKNCEDPDFSAYMLDAYAAGAKNYVTPAYIEVNLMWKTLRDEESHEILEYIFDHIVYDIGRVYNFGDLHTMFGTLANSGSTDVASGLDSIRDSILTEIEDVIFDYETNDS